MGLHSIPAWTNSINTIETHTHAHSHPRKSCDLIMERRSNKWKIIIEKYGIRLTIKRLFDEIPPPLT